MKELTNIEKRFCKEYNIDCNGTRAATDAGYAAASAHVRATRLLKKDNIQAELKRLYKAKEKRTKVTADKIINELAMIAYLDIDGSDTKAKYSDKTKALELLMKHMGLLTEKLQIEQVDKGVSIEDLGLPLEEAKRILELVKQAKLNKEIIQE